MTREIKELEDAIRLAYRAQGLATPLLSGSSQRILPDTENV